MGLTKTVTTIYSAASLAANTESALADCTVQDLSTTTQLALTIRCTYNASGTKAALVKVWTSSDNANYDTEVLTSFENGFAAGATKQKTVYINPDAKYIKCTVLNQDTSYAITSVSVIATKQDLA